MAISISGTHQQLKRKRSVDAEPHNARQLENNGPPIQCFAPKKCNLHIAPHTLPRQSACVPAVRDGLPTVHCQSTIAWV
jgi:hypothetical protein